MITHAEKAFSFRHRETVQEGFVLEVFARHSRRPCIPNGGQISRNLSRGMPAFSPAEIVSYEWAILLNGRYIASLKLLPNGSLHHGPIVFRGMTVIKAARDRALVEIARRRPAPVPVDVSNRSS